MPSERGVFRLGSLTLLAKRYLFLYWRGNSSSQPICRQVGLEILQGFRRLEISCLRAFPSETGDGSDHVRGFALGWTFIQSEFLTLLALFLFVLIPSVLSPLVLRCQDLGLGPPFCFLLGQLQECASL